MRCSEGTASLFCGWNLGYTFLLKQEAHRDPESICKPPWRTTKGIQVGREGLTDSPPTGANLVGDKEMCFLLEEHSR